MLLQNLRLDLNLVCTVRHREIRLFRPDIPLDQIHHPEISCFPIHEKDQSSLNTPYMFFHPRSFPLSPSKRLDPTARKRQVFQVPSVFPERYLSARQQHFTSSTASPNAHSVRIKDNAICAGTIPTATAAARASASAFYPENSAKQ